MTVESTNWFPVATAAFATGDAAEMRNPNATDDDVFLALAKHVPALSSPVGGNAVNLATKSEIMIL